ncbi:hypothetical protein [Gluconobacter thailandicus]|uniref:HTH-like domain-containing protein n=1 Tax=Gluconobacter thailandicus TaxID=257438 RepID=A0AAP9ET09_GLUTH|nr:hypothetical protein [Gluconobacter thailandicus]QEH96943.1 hypothetical protein FXF46_12185 [Gluconobacter thailandicus]
MTEEFRAAGLSIRHHRVGRLMRENDIRVVRTQRFKVTTNAAHSHAIEPNLLGQDFSATALNQKWTADITDIWTREGRVCLSVAPGLEHTSGGRAGHHSLHQRCLQRAEAVFRTPVEKPLDHEHSAA